MHVARPAARRRCRLLPTLLGCASLVAAAAHAEDPAAPPAPAPAAAPAAAATEAPIDRVRVDTTLGSFVIKLETQRAPLTTANFLSYVKSGHYTGTLFHRVISNFVIQGGGYDEKRNLKDTKTPVANESGNGLSNKRFTVGLARADLPHSGNAQFYVNLTDNDELDPTPLRWGYTVFGKVIEGLEVVDKIGRTPTGSVGPWPKDAPLEAVVIQKIEPLPATH
jgi:cyclophilin family peptidyl-prolyl cis-trans isomerase